MGTVHRLFQVDGIRAALPDTRQKSMTVLDLEAAANALRAVNEQR